MRISNETLCMLVLTHGPDMKDVVHILRAYLPDLLRDSIKFSKRSIDVRMQINARLSIESNKNFRYYLRYSDSAKDFALVAAPWGLLHSEYETLFNLSDICEP